MNNLESTIYNLVRKNPALKQFVRNMYQDIFDLLPKRWNISSLPINTYTGDMVKKAMQNSIGNILITKFGDRYIVDQMLAQEKIKIVSIADCRGMEIRDNEVLFLSEAQNASIDMVKLLLTRASSECKIVLEGDTEAQVDSHAFEGRNNGLKRIIERFKGEKLFGYVDLPNVWRSKLAELAEKL